MGAKESVEDKIQDELQKEVHAANVLLGKLPNPETSVPDFMKFMKQKQAGSMHREIISGMADSLEDLCKKAEQHEDDGTKDDRRDKRKAAQDLVAQLSSVVGIYAFIALLKNPGIKASNQGGKMLRENLFHIHVGFRDPKSARCCPESFLDESSEILIAFGKSRQELFEKPVTSEGKRGSQGNARKITQPQPLTDEHGAEPKEQPKKRRRMTKAPAAEEEGGPAEGKAKAKPKAKAKRRGWPKGKAKAKPKAKAKAVAPEDADEVGDPAEDADDDRRIIAVSYDGRRIYDDDGVPEDADEPEDAEEEAEDEEEQV